MKSITTIIIAVSMLIISTGSALAADDMDRVHNAKDIYELKDIIEQMDGFSGINEDFNLLTPIEQNHFLTGLHAIRHKARCKDELKELCYRELYEAKIYMNFIDGYPIITDAGGNGATLNVLTDISGYIYVVAMPKSAKGGISDANMLVDFYKNDNGLYKFKKWIQGGIEYSLPVSCGGNGNGDYRIYYCLSNTSLLSCFGQVSNMINSTSACSYISEEEIEIQNEKNKIAESIKKITDWWANRFGT